MKRLCFLIISFLLFTTIQAERLSANSGFVDFRDYFGRFLIQIRGVIYEGLILPPEFESKIGSKEPENRLKLNPQTVSEADKAIVFDFGGVIVHPDKTAFYAFIKKTFLVDDLALQGIQERFKAARDAKIPESLFWQHTADEYGITLPRNWQGQYDTVILQSINESKEVGNLIKFYKELGIKIALLSNVTQERAIFLRDNGYYDDFFPVLLSCEIGVDKPDPLAYQMMLAQVQVSPENCIFIDDKPVNVDAAKALGIDAILFLSPHQIEEELKLRLQ
jgi:putative hydrolase of the HAD superfamily